MSGKLVDLDNMVLHHETDKAWLVSKDGERENAVWLPKSQAEVEMLKWNLCNVTMPEWLAVEKGLV